MVVYNSDSQLLAVAINSEDPIIQAPDWRIRPSLAHFITNNTNTHLNCNKIPRNDNKTTHTLAKIAWHSNVSFAIPIYNHYPSSIDGQMGWAKRAARGPTYCGPAHKWCGRNSHRPGRHGLTVQARLGPKVRPAGRHAVRPV
jgi:hypothetical protein